MSVGPLVIAVSLLLFARLGGSGDYLTVSVLPASVVFGFGVAIMVVPLTATALAAAPADHAGIASGVNNAVARAAGLIAVAVLPRPWRASPGKATCTRPRWLTASRWRR